MPIQVDQSFAGKNPAPDDGTTLVPRQHERLTYPDDFAKQGNPSFTRFPTSTADPNSAIVSGQNFFYRIVILDSGQTHIEPLKFS